MTAPNLFLIAAPRSGSTQLARWLATHLDIRMPLVKEPNHFAAHDFPKDYVRRTHLDDVDPSKPPKRPAQFAIYRRREDYLSLFAGLGGPYRLDASTSYFACPEAPAAIAAACPDARVIVLTRDPVARALSHYGLARRTGRTRAPLSQELERELAALDPPGARYLIRPSQRDAGLARIRAAFDPDRVLYLDFAEVFPDPALSLQRVGNFLGIAPIFDLSASARNGAAAPRLPWINSLLHESGLKTALRRATPAPLRPVLRSIWFSERADLPVSDAEVAQLREALAA